MIFMGQHTSKEGSEATLDPIMLCQRL